jgi:hypothetical protein
MSELVLGEFSEPGALLTAVRRLRQEGLRRLETYSPFPLEGAPEALGLPRSRLPLAVLIAGLGGAGIAYSMQLFCNAIDWSLIVGNRPPHAAPMFVPITFELGVLFGSFGAFFGLFAILRLPRLYHPLDEVDRFRTSTLSGFWVSVELEPSDPPIEQIAGRLRELGAISVSQAGGSA